MRTDRQPDITKFNRRFFFNFANTPIVEFLSRRHEPRVQDSSVSTVTRLQAGCLMYRTSLPGRDERSLLHHIVHTGSETLAAFYPEAQSWM